MAEEQLPSQAPWLDHIKTTGQLKIYLDGSLGTSGWELVFKDAITKFNALSVEHRLGVSFVQANDKSASEVEAYASRGNVEFEYPPDIPKKIIKFDGTTVHGLCENLMTKVRNRARIEEWKLKKAFIYVPAAPSGPRNGRSSPVGDGVKLVIAVHELVHACGLVDNNQHSVDDVFCWPRLRMGNRPSEDRLTALGETYTFPGKPGEPPRVGHRDADMPPIFLKRQTADRIRNLWA